MSIEAKLRQVGPVGWVALTALGGVVFLCWHAFGHDADDNDWANPPADEQAPENAPIPGVLPGACGSAFRSRRYPGSLSSSRASIVGEIL